MQHIVIIGQGQFGKTILNLINHNKNKVIAYGDNNQKLWNTTYHNIPILSIEESTKLHPDIYILAVSGKDRIEQLTKQIKNHDNIANIILLKDIIDLFDIRSATIHHLIEQIKDLDGDIAELGVYQGDIAWQLNYLLPNKDLYLFDTFEGFDIKDINKEQNYSFSKEKDFNDTSIDLVLSKMINKDKVHIIKGYFPDTTSNLLDKQYCLVSLDADLYAPILSGLEYFYPRLVSKGMIILHDYNNLQFKGAKQAVIDYEKKYGKLLLVPLCDMHGTCIIVKP